MVPLRAFTNVQGTEAGVEALTLELPNAQQQSARKTAMVHVELL